jgi:hypothetical protein
MLEIIKLFHVIEESLLIANEVVKLEMVVNPLARNVFSTLFEEVLGKVFETV